MADTLYRQIADSEEDVLNITHWQMLPYFRTIQKGDTERFLQLDVIKLGIEDHHIRVTKDVRKQTEYMAVSLINTFMIAAVTGGAYPPEANRIADEALAKLIHISDFHEMEDLIHETAVLFCRETQLALQNNSGNPHCEKAKQYIRTHLTQEISVDDIADYIGLSRWHLSRIFKDACGMTIRDYILSRRIDAAEELLMTSSLSISRISSLLRFCDQSYFTACFKKHTGMTPKEYRDNAQKQIA